MSNEPGTIVDNIIDGPLDLITVDVDNDINGVLQSRYNYKGLVFPSDLASEASYNGHYMMINIATHIWGNSFLPGEVRLENEVSTNALLQAKYGMFNRTMFNRVDTTIVLYMPSTVVFTQANQYEDVSLTGIVGSGLSSLAQQAPSKLVKRIGGIVDTAVSGLGTAGKVAGAIINPMTEVLFSNTAQRQFNFEFLFAPESRQETENLEKIIKTLRFHTAPEWGGISSAQNLWWLEPSQFDISFWNKGQRNTHIPFMNTCVMEMLDVDYAPTGVYSTFSNGYPVSVRLTMKLRERSVVHKELVKAGY